MEAFAPQAQPVQRTGIETLSPREREVLVMIASGLRTEEIARQLHRSIPTIKSHRQQLGKKLGVRSRVDLTRIAIAEGMVDVPLPSREPANQDQRTINPFHILRGFCTQEKPQPIEHLIARLGEGLAATGAFIGEVEFSGRVRIRASWGQPGLVLPETLSFGSCPLGRAVQHGWCAVTGAAYPGAHELRPFAAKGIAAASVAGTPVTVVAALNPPPLADVEDIRLAIEATASHAAALLALERLRQ